jgi:hypothetical protein
MAFVLPERPSFAQQLGSGLSQGLSQSSQIAQQLGLEKSKQSQKQRLVQQLLGGSAPGADGMANQEGGSGQFTVTPEKILAATMVDPALGRNLAELYKTQEKTKLAEKEKSEITGTAQRSFDAMAKLIKRGNIGLGSEYLAKSPIGFEKTAEDVGEFSSSLAGLEAILVDMVSRGTLSNSRFNFIKETLLPQPGDRLPAIKGKLKGLANELKLDPSSLGMKSEKNGSKQSSEQFVSVKAPDGSIRKIPKDQVKSAMESGGQVVR